MESISGVFKFFIRDILYNNETCHLRIHLPFSSCISPQAAPFTPLIIPTLISPEPVPETKKLGAVTNLELRWGSGWGMSLK